MPKYKIRSIDNDSKNKSDSEYESDSETTYKHKNNLGEGKSAIARLFEEKTGVKKSIVVLKPKNKNSIGEAQTKYDFFKTNYPQDKVELLKINDTYRLILPYINGKTYLSLIKEKSKPVVEKNFLIELLLSAVEALESCHQKGLAVIDLKEDNIIFNPQTKTSHLIDGGLSLNIGCESEMFRDLVFDKIEEIQKSQLHFAPELFASNVTVKTTMDIYSLGYMMLNKLNISEKDLGFYLLCLATKANKRPSLKNIDDQLKIKLSLTNDQSEKEKLNYFIELISFLNEFHKQGYAVVNLCENSINMNPDTKKFELKDKLPLTKLKVDTPISTLDPTKEALEYFRKKFSHIAPECWTTTEFLVTEAIDIYSLGIMFKKLFGVKNIDASLLTLLDRCTDPIPYKRPTLTTLKKELNFMLSLEEQQITSSLF